MNMLNIHRIRPLTLTLTSGVKSKVGIAFAPKDYPRCGVFDPHPSNVLPSLKVDKFWPPTLTLTSEVKSKVVILFAASNYPG